MCFVMRTRQNDQLCLAPAGGLKGDREGQAQASTPKEKAGCKTDADVRSSTKAPAKPQHDPSFLQKLVASQRRQDAHWSSSDSSSSDSRQPDQPRSITSSHPSSNGISIVQQEIPAIGSQGRRFRTQQQEGFGLAETASQQPTNKASARGSDAMGSIPASPQVFQAGLGRKTGIERHAAAALAPVVQSSLANGTQRGVKRKAGPLKLKVQSILTYAKEANAQCAASS